MTDKEIEKALWRLEATKDYLREKYQEDLKNCEFPELKSLVKRTYKDNKKAFDIAIKAIEDYNRQQAEIEQWKEEANRYQSLWCEDVQFARAEAIKEFAEGVKKLTERTAFADCWSEGGFLESIDNLVKEMVGEQE